MPKVKIGEKIVAGDNNNGKREFTDGHKSFDSFAARILTETQLRERRTLDSFEKNKATFVRPRNPIVGEPTPRTSVNATGEVIQQTGELLFPSRPQQYNAASFDQISPRPFSSSSTPRLGSSKSSRSINIDIDDQQPDKNPLKRTDEKAERISSLQNMQDNITGELEYLKAKLLEKQQRLSSLSQRSSHK